VQEHVDALIQVSGRHWLAFEDPTRVVCAETHGSVRDVLHDVERLTRELGLHAVGYITYEAGGAFGLPVHADRREPLAWFGLFDPAGVRRLDAVAGCLPESFVDGGSRPLAEPAYALQGIAASLDRTAFRAAFARIRAHIAAGDTYQVNFTFPFAGTFAGDPRAFFADLVAAQQGRHSAYLRIGDRCICSASPESFFALDGVTIAARPMKGTRRRGRTLGEDREHAEALRTSPKERAENVMIVDMLRSDIGRIAHVGSVAVPELFAVEQYPNVWQMTSLVTARSTASLAEIFAAVHPAASVTGAPKKRTMEIVREVERTPRGIYTGAIGHVPPDGNAQFNVAIRTAVIDLRDRTFVFGAGSGIVWDSDADAEYDECLLKASVLAGRQPPFELLETIRWTEEEGFALLDRHLARLGDAGEYFDVPVNLSAVRSALGGAVKGQSGAVRVRLLVSRDGGVRVERQPLQRSERPLVAAFAAGPIDARSPFLFHKTTNRETYERARVAGADETILWNAEREVTEGLTTNVVAEIDGVKVTPPVRCGLLAGTYRAELLGRGDIREAPISIAALQAAARIWLINSVHDSRPAVLRS
jgi:para-aminobenzoate synthetase/4-amino-4-deoxychorismate lyase